jgi:hypothetical protein
MLKFSKKPNIIFTKAIKKPIAIECIQINEPFEVESKEGLMKGKPGDWLMVGVKGELYICDKDIFEESYNLIQD